MAIEEETRLQVCTSLWHCLCRHFVYLYVQKNKNAPKHINSHSCIIAHMGIKWDDKMRCSHSQWGAPALQRKYKKTPILIMPIHNSSSLKVLNIQYIETLDQTTIVLNHSRNPTIHHEKHLATVAGKTASTRQKPWPDPLRLFVSRRSIALTSYGENRGEDKGGGEREREVEGVEPARHGDQNPDHP